MKTKKSAAATPPRFVKLSAAGKELAASAKTWAQVLDRKTDLIWTANTVGPRAQFADAKKLAENCGVGDHTDWRLPTIEELLSLVDYTRCKPAIDTAFFRCESSWYWSSTPDAESPSVYAWYVYFNYGGSYVYLRSGTAFVRAVRSARASQ